MKQLSAVSRPSNPPQCIGNTTRATVEVLGDSHRIPQPLVLASSNVPADFATQDGPFSDQTEAYAWIGALHGDHRLSGRR